MKFSNASVPSVLFWFGGEGRNRPLITPIAGRNCPVLWANQAESATTPQLPSSTQLVPVLVPAPPFGCRSGSPDSLRGLKRRAEVADLPVKPAFRRLERPESRRTSKPAGGACRPEQAMRYGLVLRLVALLEQRDAVLDVEDSSMAVAQLRRLRFLAQALGDDRNDHATIRRDPLLAFACDRLPSSAGASPRLAEVRHRNRAPASLETQPTQKSGPTWQGPTIAGFSVFVLVELDRPTTLWGNVSDRFWLLAGKRHLPSEHETATRIRLRCCGKHGANPDHADRNAWDTDCLIAVWGGHSEPRSMERLIAE